MTQTEWIPLVEIGVALIQDREKILVIYNPRWGAFTLPMSKRKRWNNNPAGPIELWEDAVARAAAECLGRTVFLSEAPLLEKAGVQQSDREGNFAEYRFHVFGVETGGQAVLASGILGEWLTADEILDTRRRALSSTAVEIIGELRSQGRLG